MPEEETEEELVGSDDDDSDDDSDDDPDDHSTSGSDMTDGESSVSIKSPRRGAKRGGTRGGGGRGGGGRGGGGGAKGGSRASGAEAKSVDEDDEEVQKLRAAIDATVVRSSVKVKWSDVAGLDVAKGILKDAVIMPTLFPQAFKGARKPPKGILLYGPPGTGKSFLAKAVATEATSVLRLLQCQSIRPQVEVDGRDRETHQNPLRAGTRGREGGDLRRRGRLSLQRTVPGRLFRR